MISVLQLAQKNDAVEYELYAHMGLAEMFLNAGNNQAAEKAHPRLGITIAQKTGSRYELKDLYFKAGSLGRKRGKPSEALSFWKKFQQLNDSVINEKNKTDINLIEAKYESEKKENLIKQLESEKQLQHLDYPAKKYSELFIDRRSSYSADYFCALVP